jgi:hypothetical protein
MLAFLAPDDQAARAAAALPSVIGGPGSGFIPTSGKAAVCARRQHQSLRFLRNWRGEWHWARS